MAEVHSLDPAVLGHILLLQSAIHAQPDDQHMAEFLAAGMTRIPGVGGAAVCKDGLLLGASQLVMVPPLTCREAFQPKLSDLECPPSFPCVERGYVRLSLRSARRSYGGLLLRVTDENAFTLYRPFVENIASLVTLLIENREQERNLIELNHSLEQQVQERTANLQHELAERHRKEEALRESEIKYRRLHDSMMDAFALVDMTGHILETNPAYQSMVGYSDEELKLLTYQDLTPEKWRSLEVPIIEKQVLVRGYSEVYEKEYQRKDGTLFPVEMRTFLLRDSAGQPAGMWAIVRDITARKRAEIKAAESEARFRALFEQATDGMVLADAETKRFLLGNRQMQQWLGYSEAEFLQLTVSDIHPAAELPYVLAQFEKQARGEITFVPEIPVRRKDGSVFYADVNAATILVQQRAWLLGIFRDITERKQAEAELDKTRGLLSAAVEQSPAGILIADAPDVRIRLVNSAALGIRGQTAQPLTDIPVAQHPRNWQTFYPDGTPCRPEELPLSRAVLAGETTHNVEVIIRRADGEDRWVLANAAPVIGVQGEVIAGVVVFLDITERKRAEQELRASLDEKVALLKEVHHRVKNNLQIISSLLNLQAREVRSPEVQIFLQDTQSRIQAMALLHETLYGSSNLACVSFRRYVESICTHIVRSHASDARNIYLRRNIADVGLPLDQAIPAGLVINELVSNALKHAFSDRPGGEITVQLQSADEHHYVLQVADNGTGIAVGTDAPHTKKLGLRLVEALVNQLEGKLTVRRDIGTTFQVVFPKQPS
jgi:PAS domain S-box-containing protein